MKSKANNRFKVLILRLGKLLLISVGLFILSSFLIVGVFRYVNLPFTPIMVIRIFEGWFEGRNITIHKDWVKYNEISPNFFRAVISAEDAKFMRHSGFDWQAIENAKKYNERRKGKKKRGASTITMQTAKNAFLWHGRVYVRKGFEAYFTLLIEWIWGKRRILEVYANIIEFGEGIYGVEEASQRFFGKPAAKLTKQEAALIAAVLPNPRRWSPAEPTNYILKRAGFIRGRMNSIALPKD